MANIFYIIYLYGNPPHKCWSGNIDDRKCQVNLCKIHLRDFHKVEKFVKVHLP
jgi:hypothetical protein